MACKFGGCQSGAHCLCAAEILDADEWIVISGTGLWFWDCY